MSLHRNRVQMTVTGAPGAGTITLNAATTGYQSFASAYGADATVDILIVEGNNWEVCRNCAYTNSGTTVTRTTPEASSAGGSAVSFGSGAIVSVIATAAAGNNWGLNEISASPTGAGVTGVVGTLHLLNIGGLTASRDFTLPATCAVGDRVGVFITTGDDAFELSLKPATVDTINGGSAGAEWSRLFITGECVIFRCITADTDWIVEYDGRIACAMDFSLSTSESGTKNANTFYSPTAVNGAWTANRNVGNCGSTTNGRFTARRNGVYLATGLWGPTANVLVGNSTSARMLKNGTSGLAFVISAPGAAIFQALPTIQSMYLVTTDYIEFQTRGSAASQYASNTGTYFGVAEVL